MQRGLTFQSMVVTSRLTSVKAGKCFNTIGSKSASSPLVGICQIRAVASPDLEIQKGALLGVKFSTQCLACVRTFPRLCVSYPEASNVGDVGFQEQTNTSAVCPLSVMASLAGMTLTSGFSTTSAAILSRLPEKDR